MRPCLAKWRRAKPRRALAALLIAFVALAGAAVPPAAAQDPAQVPIKIGTFLTVSGHGAFLGAPALAALQMGIEKLNQNGGLLGRKVVLVFYDVGLDIPKAQTAVRRLIDVDKVDVIVGGSTTGTSMAVVPLVQQTGIPFISLANAVSLVEPVKQWVFKTSHTDRLACQRIFDDLAKRGFKQVGVLSGDSGFGRSMHYQCLSVAQEYGIQVVADEVYPALARDMTVELSNVLVNPGVQAILNFGIGEGPVIVTRNWHKLESHVPLYVSHGVATREYLRLAGRAAEGVRLPAPPLIVGAKLPPDDYQRPVIMDFIHNYEARWKVPPSVQGGYAFDGLGLAVAAIGRAQSTRKDLVRSQLEHLKQFVGVTGIIHMSEEDHQGLGGSAFRMVEVHNGDWVVID
jgi:branched-chain amino acid transport system substrate-binding protein